MEKNIILDNYFALRRVINIAAVGELKDIGLGPKQAAVIRIIKNCPNISLAHLASITTSDPATITRIINNLVNQGLILRKNSKTDRRAFVLSVSKKGKELAEIIKQKHTKISEKIFSCLSRDEQETLKKILTTMVEKHGAHIFKKKVKI